MTHTAVPWTIERGAELGQALILGADGVLVADLEAANWARKFEGTVTGDNAAFIVRAANCHDELLAALKGLAELDHTPDRHARPEILRARAAIAQAEPPT